MIERVGHNLFTPQNVSQLQYIEFTFNQCIDRGVTNNTSAIIQLIGELKVKCPFNNEESITATTTSTTLTTTLPESTTENLFCFDGEIENLFVN
ncbi:hypothetical protein PVAND_014601 [Polypedilum vanderplanki]|uniref:Uncharacterized protein n=1 Tax=Polypedilum vanderplanki TaxID=319348 RepID=A0A9J6BA79_POLVA|nr:hypothetical protein PVAND_014601 [Polypedilum vanderplanki]